jgi:hypothetical protein
MCLLAAGKTLLTDIHVSNQWSLQIPKAKIPGVCTWSHVSQPSQSHPPSFRWDGLICNNGKSPRVWGCNRPGIWQSHHTHDMGWDNVLHVSQRTGTAAKLQLQGIEPQHYWSKLSWGVHLWWKRRRELQVGSTKWHSHENIERFLAFEHLPFHAFAMIYRSWD